MRKANLVIMIHAFWSDNFSTFYTSILISNPTFKHFDYKNPTFYSTHAWRKNERRSTRIIKENIRTDKRQKMFSHKTLSFTLTWLIRFLDFSQMADDEVAIMEEGGMEEDETPAEEEEVAGSEEASEEAPPAEGDEDLPAEQGDAEGGEAGGGEDGEEEVLAEDAVGDDDLGIRDEDQGRPVTALRLLSFLIL